MKCKLCKINDADQTGSHITSAFLLTTQIGKRGEERGYLITTNPDQDYSENKGDALIKEDFLFCRNCERRLGIIENIYATEITQKIEQTPFEQNFVKTSFKNGHYKLECKRISSIAFQLLIQSNIWRASVSEQQLYSHFKLNAELEERMRFNLDLFLPTVIDFKLAQTEKEWTKTIDTCKDLFVVIPIAIIKAENIENKEMTYEFFDNVSKKPFHIILNEYFILLFDNELTWVDNFFDLREEFELKEIVNRQVSDAIIAIVSNERYFKTIDKIKDLALEQRLRQIEKQSIAELYRHGIPITPETLRQMIVKKVNEINQ
jgi:hypothetical protein